MSSTAIVSLKTCPGNCCEGFTLSHDGRPLALAELRELDPWFEAAVIPFGVDRNGRQEYLCTFFDRISRSCSIYEARPYFCRSFPDHGPCPFGCGLVIIGAKATD